MISRILAEMALAVPSPQIADAPLFPRQASANGATVDLIYVVLIAFSVLILLIVFGMGFRFIVAYRAGSTADRSNPIRNTTPYELTWITALFLVSVALFVWAAGAYYHMSAPASNALIYYVTGQQWFWEIQHPTGRRELNELHLPVNQPVKLVLTSKDVIHSFYVPAFRTKQDAVPGRYTSMWFTPTVPGVYHLFCAEYCGTNHSRMIGWVYVMTAADYARWALHKPPAPTAQPLQRTSETSFRDLGCYQCHRVDTNALAPYLEGLFGSRVTLSDGSTIIADENYIRQSILDPASQIVRGYLPIMPTYKGQLDERQVAQLVEAVRNLKDARPGPPHQ